LGRTTIEGAFGQLPVPTVVGDDPRTTPGEFFCQQPARGVAWLYLDGTLGYVRCGASNRCDYCAMLSAVENSVVLQLDAFDGDFARVAITTTTWKPYVDPRSLANAERQLWRALRRDFPMLDYCGVLEWTPGTALTSGGHRRPHIHHGVKRMTYDPVDAVVVGEDDWGNSIERLPRWESHVSTLWRRYSPDGAWRVECAPLRSPMGMIRYMILHHYKRSQAPPPGTRNVKRLRPSIGTMTRPGYFNRPVAEYRAQAREMLRDERLYAKTVELLELPDRLPEALFEELVARSLEQVEQRAKWEAPRLCHVRERPVVDKTSGEVRYVFEGVLRVLGKPAMIR
jgi:hypothetical protein